MPAFYNWQKACERYKCESIEDLLLKLMRQHRSLSRVAVELETYPNTVQKRML